MPLRELVALCLKPVLFAALSGLFLAPLESLLPLHGARRTAYATDLAFASLGQVLARVLSLLFVGTTLSVLEPYALSSPFDHVAAPGLRAALELGSGLVLFELAGYAYHRLAHASPLLFRLHRVHHASGPLDWLGAFRQHPLEIALMTLVQNAPLVLVGLPLGSHALLLVLLKLHTVVIHANLRVPRSLAWVIATPAYHHRHHACGPGANYASLLTVIDRVFATAADDDRPAPRAARAGFWALLRGQTWLTHAHSTQIRPPRTHAKG